MNKNYHEIRETYNNPSFKLDGDYENYYGDKEEKIKRAAQIISKYAGIQEEKILFFLKNIGIEKFFNETSIIGLTPDQEQKVRELKFILEYGE